MKRLSKSVVGQKEAEAVSKVIVEGGYLGMGAEVAAFEKEIATFLGVETEDVTCVNTGTSALHLATQAVTKLGDEILVPSFTYLASFQAISAAGAKPVACDVDENTFSINLQDAQARLTERTKAIMPVHYASCPSQIDEIYEFAKKNNLRVIEDAAHAFGCTFDGKKIGAFGDIVCFSFDGIKNITSGEGGAIVTGDKEISAEVRDTRLLGVEKDTENRYQGKRSWEFDVTKQGYRYHMSNIFAAIGRVQLSRFESEFAPKRIFLSKTYRELLSKNDKVIFQKLEKRAYIIPHIMVIRVPASLRDGLKEELEKSGVQTGLHYKPNHLLSYYKTLYSLPVTERLYKEILTLPLHPEIEKGDVEEICEIIDNYINR